MSTAAKLVLILPPHYWISYSFCGLLIIVINGFILTLEVKAHINKSSKISMKFPSKYAGIYSTLVHICVVLVGIGVATLHFDHLCHLAGFVYIPAVSTSFLIGLYQLDRLYHCFAKNKFYSRNGYPKWLFVIMYIIGCVQSIVSAILFPLQSLHTVSECGINANYEYFEVLHKDIDSELNHIIQETITFSYLVYLLWDITTLILYIIKIITFRKYGDENKHVYNQIMKILTRVLILTIMYELPFFLQMISRFIHGIYGKVVFFMACTVSSITWGLAIFLMQQHNTPYYEKFLQIIYRCKLHYLCCICCFKGDLIQQSVKKEIELESNASIGFEEMKGFTDTNTPSNDLMTFTVTTQFDHVESQQQMHSTMNHSTQINEM